MDDGHVIPGLGDDWTFASAKMGEWMAGLTSALLASLMFDNVARSMPFLVLCAVGATLLLASLRRQFPDEERGVRNLCMTKLGIAPPGIPAPASIQPRWSGGRLQGLSNDSTYVELGLDDVFERIAAENRR